MCQRVCFHSFEPLDKQWEPRPVQFLDCPVPNLAELLALRPAKFTPLRTTVVERLLVVHKGAPVAIASNCPYRL